MSVCVCVCMHACIPACAAHTAALAFISTEPFENFNLHPLRFLLPLHLNLNSYFNLHRPFPLNFNLCVRACSVRVTPRVAIRGGGRTSIAHVCGLVRGLDLALRHHARE